MNRLNRKGLIVFGVVLFLVTAFPFPAHAQYRHAEVSGAGVVADVVLLRPLGFAATVIGTAFFVATLPFTVWSRNSLRTAGHYLVVEPGGYTFARPLGQWDPP